MSVREDAARNGNITYQGRPCKNCGQTEKYVLSASCVSCTKKNATTYNKKTNERLKELRRLADEA